MEWTPEYAALVMEHFRTKVWSQLKNTPDREDQFHQVMEQDYPSYVHVIKSKALDPLQGQIVPLLRWNEKIGRSVANAYAQIDGLRLLADRTGLYMPGHGATFELDEGGRIYSARVGVKRFHAETREWHEISEPALLAEYMGEGPMWKKMAGSQLAKCSEARGLRRAFPGALSGIYTLDEMDQSFTADDRARLAASSAAGSRAAASAASPAAEGRAAASAASPKPDNGGGSRDYRVEYLKPDGDNKAAQDNGAHAGGDGGASASEPEAAPQYATEAQVKEIFATAYRNRKSRRATVEWMAQFGVSRPSELPAHLVRTALAWARGEEAIGAAGQG